MKKTFCYWIWIWWTAFQYYPEDNLEVYILLTGTKSESDWSAKIQNFGISCWIRWVRYYHTRELLIYNIKLTYLCNLALHIYDHNRTDSKCFHPFHRIDLEMLMAWSRWNKWHTFYETPCYSKPLFQHETPFHRILDKHFGHPHPTWL